MTLDLMTLQKAADTYGIPVATLRWDAKIGRLSVSKLGRLYYTTPADIAEWVEKCRVKPAPISTSTEAETPTSSVTEVDQSELDAILKIKLAPNSGLQNTSPASTGRRRRPALASGT